jgi:LuxR family transcriptional regulator, maltose regulon positive regulatory protein
MLTPILTTRLFKPSPRPKVVLRPELIARLNQGLRQNQGFSRKLTLISAPAGFGKTTLASAWAADCEQSRPGVPVAWWSLDSADNDATCFLTYLIAALQTVAPKIGEGVLKILQSLPSQPPALESLVTTLLNDLNAGSVDLMLVLDDYHLIEAPTLNQAMTFLIEHLPPCLHLVIITREDPPFPLARWRARGQLTELRSADLRFRPAETAEFLNPVMGLNLSTADINVLEKRTEGWIAGLQLAAISMQGDKDTTGFISSFSGSHHFVLDYLLEEVLQKQSPDIQSFLLRTSILDRLCGSLCDAVCATGLPVTAKVDLPAATGQATLEYLEHSNLFIVPLDDQRGWYRYHHLFADLLRQRLRQSAGPSTENEERVVAELHQRASAWYADHGLDIEAFQHAAAAQDVERAERLIVGKTLHLHFSGRAAVLEWLGALPVTVLNARPSLWVIWAWAILGDGQSTGVEEKLLAAEASLPGAGPGDKSRDLIGQIATARATLALSRYQPDAMITQARRALEYLRLDNTGSRFTAHWIMAFAYRFRGERDQAGQAFSDALSLAEASGNKRNTSLATMCLGEIQELNNQLHPASENYRRALQLLGDQPPPSASEAHLGLARIFYEWNDLGAAEQHGQQSLQLAHLYDQTIDRFILGEVFLARLKLAQGDVEGAASRLAQTEQTARQKNFTQRLPEIAAAQAQVLLKQNNRPAAAEVARRFELPLNQARVKLAEGDSGAALAVLEPFRLQMEARGWTDERLKAMLLQALALHLKGAQDQAVALLGEVLALAEPGGFVRLFVDEGLPMAQLLSTAAAHKLFPEYIEKLLAAFRNEQPQSEIEPAISAASPAQPLNEPLSQRELEILQLIARGLSNREISARLFLALDTVKGHNRLIFGKLQVERRTEAVARARELGLL